MVQLEDSGSREGVFGIARHEPHLTLVTPHGTEVETEHGWELRLRLAAFLILVRAIYTIR